VTTEEKSGATRPIAFFVTPFSPETAGSEDPELFKQVGDAIRQAAKEAGVELQRADDIFESGIVIDQVRRAIREADVVVAVCTGRNPNVFYELGLADEQGHSPILIAACNDDLPFDVHHRRAQLYTGSQTVGTLAVRVERAIRETLQAKHLAATTADRTRGAVVSAAVGAAVVEPMEVLDGPPGTKLLIYDVPDVTHDEGAAVTSRLARAAGYDIVGAPDQLMATRWRIQVAASSLPFNTGGEDHVAPSRPRYEIVENNPTQAPNSAQAPAGWAVLPLLQVRVVSYIGGSTMGRVGLIRERQRANLTAALDASAATNTLVRFTALPSASAVTALPEETEPLAPWEWVLNPDVTATLKEASYRLGGDASAGVSALVNVKPPWNNGGNDRYFIFDAGVSATVPVALSDLASLIRDGLVLVTAELPAALSDILPPGAQVCKTEVHLLAHTVTGSRVGADTNRANDLSLRVELTSMGPLNRPSNLAFPTAVFVAQVGGPLSIGDATELTVEGIEYMASEHGWHAPTAGISMLRGQLESSRAD
jgi:hypothetical protein